MRARDIMTPNPLVVTPSDPVSHAAAIMRDAEIGIVPVVDDREHRHLVGVITDRDIAVRCVASQHIPACDVSLHMSGDHLCTVGPDDDVAEDNRLIGMISQADLATKLGPAQPLEVEKMLESVSVKEAHSQADGSRATSARG